MRTGARVKEENKVVVVVVYIFRPEGKQGAAHLILYCRKYSDELEAQRQALEEAKEENEETR
jgi:hypothetical protein